MLLIIFIIQGVDVGADVTFVDHTKCKVTHPGSEYIGCVCVAESTETCRYWSKEKGGTELPYLSFPYGSKAQVKNHFRNPSLTKSGPWCYTADKKDSCRIPLCKITGCRVTGPGVQYAGNISRSASGRKCRERTTPDTLDGTAFDDPVSPDECKSAGTANNYTLHLNQMRSKRESMTWTNATGDPGVNTANILDRTMKDSASYCGNPNKSVGGVWSFTSGVHVPRDCARDCDKLLECTIISSGFKPGHLLYIKPSWRKYGLHFWIKTWDPDIYEGLKVELISLDGERSYSLLIGDVNNEKLKFYFVNSDGKQTLLVHKTLLHLVPAGKWGGFWLRPDVGKVELGYLGVDKPFFEWTSNTELVAFDPTFMNFGTIQDHWIGVNFLCSECLLERTTSSFSNRIYPINLWRSDRAKFLFPSKLTLNLRGMASVAIVLLPNPDFDEYMSVKLSSDGEKISIWEYRWNLSNRKLAEYDSVGSFSPNHWTEYELNLAQKSISLKQDNTLAFKWKSRQHLLFYWFSIQVYQGYVVWTANCPPGDIDGPPRNGQWGAWEPWSCSVTCGGGLGRTQRACNNPPPNVFGRECKGSAVYYGPCNTFPCGVVSPGTHNKIRQHLSSRVRSLEVEAGKRIVLTCNDDARSTIMAEVKAVNITWTLNGFPFNQKRARLTQDNSLVVLKACEKDNGVYLCTAHQDTGSGPSKIVIEVVALVVNRTTPTNKISEGKTLSLKCNGLALSYVYGDLSQRWEINGTVWKDYGITTLETVNIDVVEGVTNSHDGIWTCVILQQDLGFRWTTNWMYIKVKSAPTFWTQLTEDVPTKPLFGKLGSERNVKIVFFFGLAVIVAVNIIIITLLVSYDFDSVPSLDF